MASCINHFVENFIDQGVLKLTVFSDNCAGQNKNKNLVLSYLRFIHFKRFSAVYHYYLEVGHSYLPCDRDFRVFKKYLRKVGVHAQTLCLVHEIMQDHRPSHSSKNDIV